MDSKELLKKIRSIEIKTRGLSNQVFTGEYHSAFKGRGMSFSEVREYCAGDDVRSIDWNVTARFNNPYVKVFEEERELTVILMIDLSSSGSFGSHTQKKKDLIAEISAVIAFSAIQNNDKVGVILFTDRIEKFIPPKKGKSHILQIIREILNFETKGHQTSVGTATGYFASLIKRRSIAFIISDFITEEPIDELLKIIAKRHDLIALKIEDPKEKELPQLGFIQIKDLESDSVNWVINRKKDMINYHVNYRKKEDLLHSNFRKAGVDFTTLKTGEDYIKNLMQLFKNRRR